MSQSTSKYTLVATDVCHVWYRPFVHFVNAIPISLICLFSSVKNYIALSLSLSYTSRVMAFKGLSKYFFFHWDYVEWKIIIMKSTTYWSEIKKKLFVCLSNHKFR